MSEIKFACPHCDQHIACDESYGGSVLQCPACLGAMRIPQRHTAPPNALRLAPSAPGVGRTPLYPTVSTVDPWTEEEWNRHVAKLGRIRGRPFVWIIFFIVLLTPALISTVLWSGVDINTAAEGILAGEPGAPTIRVLMLSFILSVCAGLFCGFWACWHQTDSRSTRVIVGLSLSLPCSAFCYASCFLGCIASPALRVL